MAALYDDEDWDMVFVEFKNADGTPYSLAGATLEMVVKKDKDEQEPLLLLTTANGGLVVYGASNNQVRMIVPYAGRPAMEQRSHYYSLTKTNGGRKRLCSGKLNVTRGV